MLKVAGRLALILVIAALSGKDVNSWDVSPTVLATVTGSYRINLQFRGDNATYASTSALLEQTTQHTGAQPESLGSEDFDRDGIGDLVIGYRDSSGAGMVALQRGNVDSIYPDVADARHRKASGTFTDAPFLPPTKIFHVPAAPDLLEAGDFNGDGNADVVVAARGSDRIYLMKGDGRGALDTAVPISLPGTITAMIAGEINRADGVPDLVIGITGREGARVMVLQSGGGALKAEPEFFRLPGDAADLRLGTLDSDNATDLAVAAGNDVVIVHGRDRVPARIEQLHYEFGVASIAIGDFIWDREHRPEMALMGEDGAVHLLRRGDPDTRPYSEEELGAANANSARRRDTPSAAQRVNDETWILTSEDVEFPALQGPSHSQSRSRLTRAHVSGLPIDDLILVDAASQKLHILETPVNSLANNLHRSGQSRERRTTINMRHGAPLAVLPMRLNKDALDDLVMLTQGPEPVVFAMTIPNLIITVNTTDFNEKRDDVLTLFEAISIANGVCTLPGGQQGCLDALTPAERRQVTGNPGIGLDEIKFSINTTGVPFIAPHCSDCTSKEQRQQVSALFIDDSLIIDASPLVRLSGVNAGGDISGLLVHSGSLSISNMVIERWTGGYGIELSPNSTGSTITNNLIGTDDSGTAGLGGQIGGVGIIGSVGNTIGGSASVAGNVISGNGQFGVEVKDVEAPADGNSISRNWIGTNRGGSLLVPNGSSGINIQNAKKTLVESNSVSGNKHNGIEIKEVQGKQASDNRLDRNLIANNEMTGVVVSATHNVVGGNAITQMGNEIVGNKANGVQISGPNADGNSVIGNFIGILGNGVARPNLQDGILVTNAPRNRIGASDDPQVAPENVIASNGRFGVEIVGTEATGNQIANNFIGLSNFALGELPLGNGFGGVNIQDAPNNTVGGTRASGNVISANAVGVQIVGEGATENIVQGNRIGTDFAETRDLGNTAVGVLIMDASNNLVGGGHAQTDLDSSYNTIVFSGFHGVQIFGNNGVPTGNKVIGNYIGVTPEAMPAGNHFSGVLISQARNTIVAGDPVLGQQLISGSVDGVIITGSNAKSNTILGNIIEDNSAYGVLISNDASNNTVGGEAAPTGQCSSPCNSIGNNHASGVAVTSGFGNSILSNAIAGNGGLGIDLSNDGPTINDLFDLDTGPNGLQNFLELTRAELSPDGTTVKFFAERGYLVPVQLQFFWSARCDASGYGEGQRFVFDFTDSPGVPYKARVTGTFPNTTGRVAIGGGLTVTATDVSTGDTSEFSKCVEVKPLDTDDDGSPDVDEDRGPNNGDANGDHIPDREQATVASVRLDDGRYELLQSDGPITNARKSFSLDSANNTTPPPPTPNGAADFPGGLLEWILNLGTSVNPPNLTSISDKVKLSAQAVQNSAAVTIFLPTGSTANSYYNFGPEPGNPGDHWYPFLYDGTTGAEFQPDRLILHFVDGQRGDHDLTVNGSIATRGGPARIQPSCDFASSTTSIVGISHSSIATVNFQGNPLSQFPVTFSITSGPNSSMVPVLRTTDPLGQVTFTYTSSRPGTDTIQASGVAGNVPFSCTGVQTWTLPDKHADLSLSNVDTPHPVSAGGNLTYTITVSNAGPDDAMNVSVTDSLPVGLTVLSCTTTSGGCFAPSGNITIDIPLLAANTSATATIVTRVASAVATGTVLNNTADVSSDASDSVPTNNSATASTTVSAQADLVINKTGSPNFVKPGGTIIYVINLNNAGPSDAANVMVTDNLPAEVSFVSCSSTHGGVCGGSGNNRTVLFTSLPAGTQPVITLVATALSTLGNGITISNTATVASATLDPAPANNSSTAAVAVETPSGNPNEADLSVTVTDSPDPVAAGQNVTYSITVINNGPSDAVAVHIVDNLPPQLVFLSCTVSTSNLCGASGNLASVTIRTLPVNASAVITIVASVDPATTNGLTIANTVSVQSESPDSIHSNNSATTTTLVNAPTGAPRADLAVNLAASPAPVVAGSTVLYAITVNNSGPNDATSVTLADSLPTELNFLSCVSTSGGVCNGSGNDRTVTFPLLPSGASALVSLTATVRSSVPGGALITNTATVASAITDPAAGNNSATITTPVTTRADVSIIETVMPNPVLAGGNVTYSLTVRNAGPSDAVPVTVIDSLPAEVNFVSCSSAGGGVCGGSGNARTVVLSSLPAGTAATVTIASAVRPNIANGTNIMNTVIVASPSPDPAPDNNSATAATTVIRQADLGITESASTNTAAAGSGLSHTITVTNTGPSEAALVTVLDSLPPELLFVSCGSTNGGVCSGSSNSRTITFPSLAAGESAVVTINSMVRTNVSDGAAMTNAVSVSSATPDPSLANNSTVVSTTATTTADVAVAISASPDPVNVGSTVTYSILVRNDGPGSASNVTLVHALPPEVHFVSCNATTAGVCGGSLNERIVTFPSLQSGGSASVILVASVDPGIASGTLMKSTASVYSLTTDTNYGNNSGTATTTARVNCVSDLAVRPKQTKAELSWTPLAGIDRFNIYRGSASGGPYTRIGQVPGNVGFYLDEGPLTTGGTYYWVVRAAQTPTEESCQSNQASARVTGR